MNDGVYFGENGNEVIVSNGFEYSREEFDSLVDMCGAVSYTHLTLPTSDLV